MVLNLSGAGSVPHSIMKLSNVRNQYFHSFAAVGEFGSRSRRSGFSSRFMMMEVVIVSLSLGNSSHVPYFASAHCADSSCDCSLTFSILAYACRWSTLDIV